MSDHTERMADAIRTAEESRGGNLLSIGARYFPGMAGNGKVKVCPGCESKDKFSIFKTKSGHWTWGCFKPSCNLSMENIKADKHGDAIGMIQRMDGLSRSEAVDKYLEICGVHNPRKDLPEKGERKKKSTSRSRQSEAHKPEDTPAQAAETPAAVIEEDPGVEQNLDETPAPPPPVVETQKKADNIVSFSLTDEEPPPPAKDEPSVWDDLFSRLALDNGDRELLKRKRGFTKETIDSAGYRTSAPGNRELLAPLLDAWPHGLLLAEGIVTKDPETGRLKINPQLCGYGLKKRGSNGADDEWGLTNPILIPYRNERGRLVSIRPHKGGLSGKRFMREHGYEHGFRSSRTRTKLYTSFLFWERPEKWKDSCVLTEGEFKADALAQCGIPACAVPGIQMPRNEIFFEQVVKILRQAGIKKVIIAYDNEDKSHKPDPWSRYEADVYALYACHALRSAGFHPSHCTIPDEWRIEGKADWDSALAKHKDKAPALFAAALKKAKPYFPQTELFGTNERDRIIHCKLNRLKFEPQILTGGDEEEDLARLLSKCKGDWRIRFQTRELIKELYDTKGCYYIPKPLPFKDRKPYFSDLKLIRDELRGTPAEDLDKTAELEAALAAVKHILKGRPEILSDFTISCDFQVRTQSGEIHRLFRFRNKHGQISDYISVPPSATSTSSKFREFCYGCGNFNLKMGDKQLQQLMEDLGTFSAWRELRELEMLGRDPDSNLWIFGDCAFVSNSDLFAERKAGQEHDVLFADKHDIVWYDGIGYRLNPGDLSEFSHKHPPKFFQEIGKTPSEVYAAILADPEKERLEVAKIFFQFCADMICTFGDSSGLLAIGAVLSHCAAPEMIAKLHGHPGLWIHGLGGAGKSEQSRFFMQLWGYPDNYRTFMLAGGTTAVAIDRAFAQYSDILMHADEFRVDEADKNRIASLRGPFNRQSKSKGRMDASNKTRSVQPMTSPMVTGEGVTNDSATLSRYIEVILASNKRLGTPLEQAARYERMLTDSFQYHRIIRYILLNRKWFSKTAIATTEEFLQASDVLATISWDRMRLTYGSAFAAVKTLIDHFGEAAAAADKQGTIGPCAISPEDFTLLWEKIAKLREFTVNYAKHASSDVTSINFIVKFWKDVTSFLNIDPTLNRFIWFRWCTIDPETNLVRPLPSRFDAEGTFRCIIVKPSELYAEYQKLSRQRGHEPELSESNIRGQCKNERYWVAAPTSGKNRSHRFAMRDLEDNGKGQIANCWVLRFDRMNPSLQDIFSEKFEQDEDPHQDNLSF